MPGFQDVSLLETQMVCRLRSSLWNACLVFMACSITDEDTQFLLLVRACSCRYIGIATETKSKVVPKKKRNKMLILDFVLQL